MTQADTPEQRLAQLGLTLPPTTTPIASFLPFVITGSLLFLSGKGAPTRSGQGPVPRLGAELSIEQGQGFARDVALFHLATLKQALGELSRVRRVVKVLGFVNATADFREHPEVVNGYSDLMIAVFAERGRHSRSAVGMGSLPRGFAVEVETVVEIESL